MQQMRRIKLTETYFDRGEGGCELYLCLRPSVEPGRAPEIALHLKGTGGFVPTGEEALTQLVEPNDPQTHTALDPWLASAPAGMIKQLHSRVLIEYKGKSAHEVAPGRVIAQIQPEFLSPAVAAEVASSMDWPISQLQMSECIARACAQGQWPAPVINLLGFSVKLQFEGERLRLVKIEADGSSGRDLKAAERVRYVRDCEAGRFSISTPGEVFEGASDPRRAVEILKDVGGVIGAKVESDSSCFDDPQEPLASSQVRSESPRG